MCAAERDARERRRRDAWRRIDSERRYHERTADVNTVARGRRDKSALSKRGEEEARVEKGRRVTDHERDHERRHGLRQSVRGSRRGRLSMATLRARGRERIERRAASGYFLTDTSERRRRTAVYILYSVACTTPGDSARRGTRPLPNSLTEFKLTFRPIKCHSANA